MLRRLVLLATLLVLLNAACQKDGYTFHNGKVAWIPDQLVGKIECHHGYHFVGNYDVVYCDTPATPETGTFIHGGKCENKYEPTKVVEFHGQRYNFTFLKMTSKASSFSLKDPNMTYIITTNYTVNEITPTVRVKASIAGKAVNPVMINVLQSSESIGFSLPRKSNQRGNLPALPLTTKTVELCPIQLETDNGTVIPVVENVKISVNSRQPEKSDLKMFLHITHANHIDLVADGKASVVTVDNTETQVFRYKWPATVDTVDVYISSYLRDDKTGNKVLGKGADICSRMSIRSGACPIDEMGAVELTFTRKGFITVNKWDKRLKNIEYGFLVVIEVMDDDLDCQADPVKNTIVTSRDKQIQASIKVRPALLPYSFIILPVLCSIMLIAVAGLTHFICIMPLYELKRLAREDSDNDSAIVNLAADEVTESDTVPILQPRLVINPETTEAAAEDNTQTEEDDNTDDALQAIAGGVLGQSGFTGTINGLTAILEKAKTNDVIINLTQTIGHCSIPLLVFVNSLDSAYDDIKLSLQKYLNGEKDSCFINSMCAIPLSIGEYMVPDISSVVSNLPYIICAICFYFLAWNKSLAMKPINARGRGVKHDFAIFYAIAFITGLIGLASAVYHVCPNQTTSRIDMYFIEILLGYYSLKLYQSRVADIRAVYYAPAIVICVLSLIERVLGDSALSWQLIAAFHIFFTFWVSVQLFTMGKVSMDPYTMFKNRKSVMKKIKECKKKSTYKYQMRGFALGNLATITLAITGIMGLWSEHALYNVVALSIDIAIYLAYYFVTKFCLRKEKVSVRVVFFLAASVMMWSLSFIFFFSYKSTNSAVTPAESRCLNKGCISGNVVGGHDLWHSLSATSILLTSIMILLIDDDLIDTKTEDTYF